MNTIPRRRIWIIARDQPLRCPELHRIREDAIVLEHTGIRCKAKLQASDAGRPGQECGALLYVVPLLRDRRLVAEVTLDELRHIEAQGMEASQALAFLGVDGPLRREA